MLSLVNNLDIIKLVEKQCYSIPQNKIALKIIFFPGITWKFVEYPGLSAIYFLISTDLVHKALCYNEVFCMSGFQLITETWLLFW